ncbi:hypothetical protein RCO48_37805 [Peribacillus frigoritolerans]|nr:hypothetical protein [Peribacillus frigoritolerans]
MLTLMKGGTIAKKKFVLEDELIIRESCGSKLEKKLECIKMFGKIAMLVNEWLPFMGAFLHFD